MNHVEKKNETKGLKSIGTISKQLKNHFKYNFIVLKVVILSI